MKIRLRPGADLGRLREALREGGAAEVLRIAREQGETAPSEQELRRWARDGRRREPRPAPGKRGAGARVSQCVGKSRYRDAAEAKKHKARAETARKTPLRIYACQNCAGFHLTRRSP